MSSSCSHQWTPEVFVNFQDEDEGVKRFTSTLFARLKQAGIGYFSHTENFYLLKIHQARFALVVFSTKYVNSRQCLDELVKILLCRGDSKYPCLVVIPIFYDIDPAKVPEFREKGEFKQALDDLRENERNDKKKEWRRALAKVEGIPRYDLEKDASGDDSKLVDQIVKRLVNEIRSLYSYKVFGPFGDKSKMSWHSEKIKGIQILYTDFIKSVTFEVDCGTDTEPYKGKSNGKDPYKVKLEEEEGIVSFSGHFGKANDGGIRIKALKFRTTQNKELGVGQIDKKREDYFSVPLPSDAGKVIAFFGGTSEGFVTSIGARVKLKRAELPPGESYTAELFGSRRGSRWDDGNHHTTVKGIRAVRDSSGNRCIRSIAFQYDNGEWRPHGSNEEWHMEVIIHDPHEYLSSISGYHTSDGITSLTFFTNKKSTITIGDGKGTHFSSPTTGYKIVGFRGWSGKHLHGIGTYFKSISNLSQIKSIGPFGCGNAWDDGKFRGVKKFYIFKDHDIRYIKIVYDDGSKDGHTVTHGDYTKGLSDFEEMVDLDSPGEHLTSIAGYTRNYGSIQSLRFHSNRKTETLGNPKGGEYFGYPSYKSRIIGFYGTCGKTLNSIGVYEELIPHWKSIEDKPFPGSGENNWDDEEHSNVVGFRVTHVNKSHIESITFMYENNGSLVEGSRHGGGDPSTGEWKILNFPEERLLRIEGYHMRSESGQTIVHNLKISTTYEDRPVHTYGKRGAQKTFDPKKHIEFTIPHAEYKDRRIVGFFGTVGKDHINSIGARLEP